jgi:hypothetical protein
MESEENMTTIRTNATHKKNVAHIMIGTALILSIPLIAMQFSDEVDWSAGDFIIKGMLLFGTGMIYEFLVKKLRTTTQQLIAAGLLLAALLLLWAELAVGVFGSPFAGS